MDPSLYTEIKAIFDKNDEHLLTMDYTTKTNDSGSQSNRYVVISEKGIYFLKGKPGKIQIIRGSNWFSLTRTDIISDDEVFLTFKNDEIYRFKAGNNGSDVAASIIYVLHKLLTEKEKTDKNFKNYLMKTTYPTSAAVLSRFKSMTSLKSASVSQEAKDYLTQQMMFKSNKLDLSKFKEDDLEYVSDAFQLCRFVQSLEYTGSKESYRMITKFIKNETENSFCHVSINDTKSNECFNEFLKSLLNCRNFNGITFNNSKIGTSELNELLRFSKMKKVQTLGFHNSIDQGSLSFFQNDFLGSNITNQLIVLTLDNTQGLDVKTVLNNAQNVVMISMANCGIEISEVLNYSLTLKVKRIKSLNLSGNNFSSFPEQFDLIGSLDTLILNDVKWGKSIFPKFFANLIRLGVNGFRLSISNLKIDEEDWEKTSKLMETSSGINFKSFIWNNSPVNKSFFKFLSTCTGINILSLASCLTDEEPENISDFNNALKNLKELKNLMLPGSDTKKLRSSAKDVIETASKISNLMLIDLSENDITSDVFDIIVELPDTLRSLQCVIVDNSHASYDDLYTFGKKIKEANADFVAFPINDVNDLLSSGAINEQQKRELLSFWQSLHKVSEKAKIFYPNNPIFDEKFEVLINQGYNVFPYFVEPRLAIALFDIPHVLPRTPIQVDDSSGNEEEEIKKEKTEEEEQINEEEQPEDEDKQSSSSSSSASSRGKKKKAKKNTAKKGKRKVKKLKEKMENEEENIDEMSNNGEKKRSKKTQKAGAASKTPKSKKRNYLEDEDSEDQGTTSSSSDEPQLNKDDDNFSDSDSEDIQRPKASSLRRNPSVIEPEDEEPIIWGFVLPLVPKPEMNDEIETINEQYSLSNLLKKMKKSA